MFFHQILEIPAEENALAVRFVSVALVHCEYPTGDVKFSWKAGCFILKSGVFSGVLTDQKCRDSVHVCHYQNSNHN